MVDLLVGNGAKVAPVRNGKLKDKARFYLQIERAAEVEPTSEEGSSGLGRNRAESSASTSSHDGLGRRLTKVFTNS